MKQEQGWKMDEVGLQQIELELLIEAVYQRYGYDFRRYNQASLKRRVQHHLAKTGPPNDFGLDSGHHP